MTINNLQVIIIDSVQFDLDSFFPEKDRFNLAMRLNNLLAAPGRQLSQHGVPDLGQGGRNIQQLEKGGVEGADHAIGREIGDAKGERGNIIFIASLNSYISLVEVLAYAASKSGVLGLVRGLANEWAQYNIRVNAIAPGVFPTDLNRPLIEGTERGKMLKWHTPMGRFGAADELVGAAVYLASPSASYTTGHTITVDGGFLSKGV